MAILLKNLLARTPREGDLPALAALVRACEGSAYSAAGSALEGLLSRWQQPDFHLADDAWVIVTTGGQPVGFACVWHEEPALISTFICVHPAYRGRGIGTLLLRMAEVRAREYTRQASPEQRVVLRGVVNSANEGARCLFEREGYQAGRPFLRISCALNPENGSLDLSVAPRKLTVDVGLGPQNQPLVATALSEQDVLCNVDMYQTYEKELRLLASSASYAPADLQALGV